MVGLSKKLREYAEISGIGEISRRYFIMNAFDGALTMLGVVIGAYIANIRSPSSIISAGMAGSLAMAISGISGAYMAEKAERLKKLKSLERAMLKNLRGSIHYRSHRFAMMIASLTDGLSPFLAAMVVLSPFFLVELSIIPWDIAFRASIAITLTLLFFMGIYLGKISEENRIVYGLQMLVIGLITAFICFIVSFLIGGNLA